MSFEAFAAGAQVLGGVVGAKGANQAARAAQQVPSFDNIFLPSILYITCES